MVIKAKSPDTSRIVYRGKSYSIEDAYPGIASAKATAEGYRSLAGRIHPNNRTLAVVVDLGKDAGRLRYAVFVAKGERV